MKRKSLITMIMSLALVAVVGAGATLAYLTASSDTLTNTFAVGEGYDVPEGFYVDEHVVDENGIKTEVLTTEGNEYTDMLPGDVLDKDPTVHFTTGPDSYIFVNVTGLDDTMVTGETTDEYVFTYLNSTLDSSATTGAWEKIDGVDSMNGIYVYQVAGEYKVEAGDTLVPLFTRIEFNEMIESAQYETLKNNISDITVEAAAVQFDNVEDKAAAYLLVKDLF